MTMPPMTPVVSKNLKAIGHDGSSLFVEFHDGGMYAYENCPAEVYGEGLVAPSPGRWHRHRVKGRYPHRKVSANAQPDNR